MCFNGFAQSNTLTKITIFFSLSAELSVQVSIWCGCVYVCMIFELVLNEWCTHSIRNCIEANSNENRFTTQKASGYIHKYQIWFCLLLPMLLLFYAEYSARFFFIIIPFYSILIFHTITLKLPTSECIKANTDTHTYEYEQWTPIQ